MKVFMITLLFLSLSVFAQNDSGEQGPQDSESVGTATSEVSGLNEPVSSVLNRGANENEVEEPSKSEGLENVALQDDSLVIADSEDDSDGEEGNEVDSKLEASESELADEGMLSDDPAQQVVGDVSETVAVNDNEMPDPVVRQVTEVVNLSATIVGNQEQPTVLYIVPWKPAEDTTILYLPLSSKAMEHIFGHVERVEHKRQVQYIEHLDKQ